ncbi:monocarboxylate transporter 12-B-like [Oppia nitens]|uniref:monocarboxylate transporter 12-B-like n=1 Tax=Oppia nitens TaxID=1686743 RepID=UPI0023DC01F6|nr:monocarboxylate transporter 12-B-like [Oppia nitens]
MLTNGSKVSSSEKTINDWAPDGGYGWVIVLASFCCNLTVDGICYTFGLFFNHFVDSYGSSKAMTALAGSLLSGCYMTAGVFVSGLTNRYGCRPITIIGSIISCLAFITSTLAPNIFILLITYGMIAGIGFGLIYLPAIVTVGYYFTTKRAFATGIAVCGSGMGAFLFAPLCQWLLSIYDWQNAIIILSGLILNCAVYGALMRPLNIVINQLDDHLLENKAINSRESGVNLTTDFDYIEVHESNNLDINYISVNSKQNKIRSKSEIRPPVLEELLPQVLHKRQSIHSSQRSIIVPPMTRKDIFYSGSTHNIKSESNGNLSGVFINNNRHSIDAKYAQKLSIASESMFYEMKDMENWDNDKQYKITNKQNNDKQNLILTIFDLSVLKQPVMVLLVVANIFGMTGYYIPFVYITQYAMTISDGNEPVTSGQSAMLVSAIGISNVLGRLLFGWISDKISNKQICGLTITALTINNCCLFIAGFVTILIPLWNQYLILLIDCILFGLFISSYMSLTSIILVDLMGIECLSTTFGLISCFRGMSSILGPPLAGALYDTTGSFSLIFICSGLLLITSSILHIFVSKYENHNQLK